MTEAGPDDDAAPWPLSSFDELADRLGRNASMVVRGRSVRVQDARDLIPGYYFPVTSAADLESKLADLQVELADHDFEQWAQRQASHREDAGGWS